MNQSFSQVSCAAVPDAARLHRLHDAAHGLAHRMRDEAIDDFWRGADTVAAASLDVAQRSAVRFAYRLARHLRRRDLASPAP